jgi:hypothetical protein
MNSRLDEACAILDDFEKEIACIKANWEQVFSENWQEQYCRMWLHGVTDVWERNELTQWLIDYPSSTAIAHSPAKKIYAQCYGWLCSC